MTCLVGFTVVNVAATGTALPSRPTTEPAKVYVAPKPSGSAALNDVRSLLNTAATTLPSALVSVSFWNQPSVTSTPTLLVGTTSVAPLAGR